MKKSVMLLIALDVIVVAALIAATVFLHSRVEVLSNQISYIQDNTNILVTDMSNLQDNIKATLEEEASKIEEWNVSVIDTDFDTNTYTVHVSVIPKEYTETTTVSVYFGPNGYPLVLDGLKFVGDVTLPLSESYKGNLTFLLVDGTSRATEVITKYAGIQEEFGNVLSGSMKEAPTIEAGKLSFSTSNDVTLNTGNYGIESFELVVERTNYEPVEEELDSVEDDASVVTSSKSKKASTTEDVADSIEECEHIDLISALAIDKNAILDAESQMTLAGEVELKKAFEISPGCSIRVYLMVETSEGFIFEYDLYSGTVNAEGNAIIDDESELEEMLNLSTDKSDDVNKNNADKNNADNNNLNTDESYEDESDENTDEDTDDSLEDAATDSSDKENDSDNEEDASVEIDHFAPNAKVFDAKGGVYFLE